MKIKIKTDVIKVVAARAPGNDRSITGEVNHLLRLQLNLPTETAKTKRLKKAS